MINIWKYSNFKLKAQAKNYLSYDNNTKITQLQKIIKNNKNIVVLWWGTNILFEKNTYPNTYFIHIANQGYKQFNNQTYEIAAGHSLTNFIKDLVDQDIHTLDPLYGLPGSVGGAVIWNAWSFGLEIGPFVKSITYITPEGDIHTTDNYEHSYRDSNYKNSDKIITKLQLQIKDNLKLKDQKNLKWYINRRKKKQNFKNTCGCFWKNPKIDKTKEKNKSIINKLKKYDNNPLTRATNQDKDIITAATGWLTETLGLKNKSKYGAKISEKHWNFVLNPDTKNGSDILKFAKWVEKQVLDEFGIQLEKEVQVY